MEPITLTLPEPPSLNAMLALAMKRTRRTRNGGWSKKALPGVVYDQHHEAYETLCTKAMRDAGIRVPRTPWPRWALTAAHFRLHNLRDPVELLAGLKWPVDWLVSAGFVENDSPAHLLNTPHPTQEMARSNRGITITITPVVSTPHRPSEGPE